MSRAEEALDAALRQVGKPYLWGAEGPSAFDCSGLVQYAYGLVGIDTPRTADEQYRWAKPVDSPAPGDLVFYRRSGADRITHVGIYAGDGRMVDAPGRGRSVVAREVWGEPVGYGRVPGAGGGVLGVVGDVVTAPAEWAAAGIDGAVQAVLGEARDTGVRVAALVGGVALLIVGALIVASRPGRALAREVRQVA